MTDRADMRIINHLIDDVRSYCLAEHISDVRGHRAFEYAVAWLAAHPPRECDEQTTTYAKCWHAVECRGRNDGESGQRWGEWESIVKDVCGRLIEWLFERQVHDVVDADAAIDKTPSTR